MGQPWLSMAVWVFNFKKLCFKSCIDMKKAGNGPFDRSQNRGPNCGNFFRHSRSVRGCWGLIWGVYMIISGINYALVCIRPEMGMKFGSKK